MTVIGSISRRQVRSFETTIHTKSVKCFVRTFRPLRLLGHWETEIVECDQIAGTCVRCLARFRHREADADSALSIHESFCRELNRSALRAVDLMCSLIVAHGVPSQRGLVSPLRKMAEARTRLVPTSTSWAQLLRMKAPL